MEFVEVNEKSAQEEFLKVWRCEPKDLKRIETHVSILWRRIDNDAGNAAVARYHLEILEEVAQSDLPIPKVHIVLMNLYRRGLGVEADPRRALEHLVTAIRMGSDEARWWYAHCLRGKAAGAEGLEEVLPINENEAIQIYKELALSGKPGSIYAVSLGCAARLLIRGRHAGQLSPDDERLVTLYTRDSIWDVDLYELARFYSDGLQSRNYAGPEYRQARELLFRGMKSRSAAIRSKCEALLDEWGVKPVPPVPPPPPTTKEKLAVGTKIAAEAGGLALGFVVWPIIGAALLAIANAVTAAVIPLLLIGVVLWAVAKSLFGKKPKQ